MHHSIYTVPKREIYKNVDTRAHSRVRVHMNFVHTMILGRNVYTV